MIVKVLLALAARVGALHLREEAHGGLMRSQLPRPMQPLRKAGLVTHRSPTHRVGYRINTCLSPQLARLVEATLDLKLAVGEAVP